MVTKIAPTIDTETFKLALNNAKTIVKLDEEMTRDDFLEVLKNLEVKCYRYVPEEELDPFRLPKGMKWGN